MYLKSLEVSGFKSFAKKATLHFTSTITGIVGPNGSGKSNTAEAFRFVLGEQSIKSLRGKRGEDMIWNGGGDSGRANRASAKLVFDNSRRLFPSIDFDEVTIERVVHRDNSNEYFLNGSQVRLKDIVETLSGAHIGATGHHIISQGEADRILSASIRERREMIEDALGLKIYQWKKLESMRKLERTEENMKQVESLRREIAPHLRFLKKQVEKVEKAEELRQELILLYKDYFADEDHFIKTEKARLIYELAGPQKELADLDHALDKARKILTDSKNKDKKSDQVIELERELAAIRSEKETIMRDLGRLDGEISALVRNRDKEVARLKADDQKTIYIKDLEEVVGHIESFKSIDDARKLWSEIVTLLKGFISKHRGATNASSLGDIDKEIETLRSNRVALEKRLDGQTEKEVSTTRKYSDLKDAIEREKDTNREAEKDVFRIIARQNEVRNVVEHLASAQTALEHQEQAFKRELAEAGMLAGREAVNYAPSTVVGPDYRSVQDERRRKIEKNKVRLEDSGGSGGGEVLKEYKETEERDAFLAKELEDLEKSKAELLKLIAELDMRIDVEFKSGILKINAEFQKYFTLMFGGGKAELTVVKEIRRKKKSDLESLGDAL